MTIPYAEVIGDPIGHSKSPMIHKFWLGKLGLDYDYRRTQVAPDALAEFLVGRRGDPDWCGCNVTIPHKQAVLEQVDESTSVVQMLGAANCITRVGRTGPRLVAENTDWSAFLEPIRSWIEEPVTYKFAYVIGTGGAAAAVSYALDWSGFTVINIARDESKALALRHRLGLEDDHLVQTLSDWSRFTRRTGRSGPDWAERSEAIEILVNTTPLGMTGYPELELDLDGFPRDLLVYDIVYAPLETGLLRQARERGMPTIDGLQMLVGQAAQAFELFFAEKAPRAFDHELRALLVR